MEGHEIKCPNCDSECREGAVFCDSCGERLPVSEPDPEPEAPELQSDSPDENDEARGAETNTSDVAVSDGSGAPRDDALRGDSAEESHTLSVIDEKIDRLLELFEDRIARTEYETATMKKLSDEVQSYRDDLYRKLTLPLIKDMISVRDALTNTLSSYSGDDADSATVPLSVVDIFSNMVEDTLAKYGVTTLDVAVGNELSSLVHKAIAKAPTDDPSLHGRIAGVSSDCYMMADECISPAMVTVFVYEQPTVQEQGAE